MSASDPVDFRADASFDAPFDAPWQAQLFGLTVALSEAGLFGWPDWTRALGAEIAQGTPYWQAWLRAFESLLSERGIALPGDIALLAARWQDAAHATPHGQPIRLENAAR
ncbi:nitrile hydratase accessory protein [Pararhodobacter marinus]|uniref:Nitrile hydratase accessory protein n=1 Tax=Pararhodobacter marinus TaxID=2184063 RepID=A0A2U2CHZ5_9RHOB|nr:nitrile hydratase accessory protein [Pararhodobacter marinus]PWE31517.1 nitrile hydratase accessory protein [Pararhodobacter marinus]